MKYRSSSLESGSGDRATTFWPKPPLAANCASCCDRVCPCSGLAMSFVVVSAAAAAKTTTLRVVRSVIAREDFIVTG